jgi:hypothetical protein
MRKQRGNDLGPSLRLFCHIAEQCTGVREGCGVGSELRSQVVGGERVAKPRIVQSVLGHLGRGQITNQEPSVFC